MSARSLNALVRSAHRPHLAAMPPDILKIVITRDARPFTVRYARSPRRVRARRRWQFAFKMDNLSLCKHRDLWKTCVCIVHPTLALGVASSQRLGFAARLDRGRLVHYPITRIPGDPAHYLGMVNGIKQVLFQRGWWPPEMGGARCKHMSKDDMAVTLGILRYCRTSSPRPPRTAFVEDWFRSTRAAPSGCHLRRDTQRWRGRAWNSVGAKRNSISLGMIPWTIRLSRTE